MVVSGKRKPKLSPAQPHVRLCTLTHRRIHIHDTHPLFFPIFLHSATRSLPPAHTHTQHTHTGNTVGTFAPGTHLAVIQRFCDLNTGEVLPEVCGSFDGLMQLLLHMRFKLIDFGSAFVYASLCQEPRSIVGTLNFIAPEVLASLGTTEPGVLQTPVMDCFSLAAYHACLR